MSDSLVIAGHVELLGGLAVSTDPRCAGARFMLGQGWTAGAPQPTSDFVASLILDGERPFGRRASNRTITLPVTITAPDRLTLAAAREVLEQLVDQDTWQMTWTRDPGLGGTPLPLVIDCFRAQPSQPVYNTLLEKSAIAATITLTIPALPYGRSDEQIQLAFAAPVPNAPPPPPSPVVLDAFSQINSPQCVQSTQCVVGPTTCYWDPIISPAFDPEGRQTALTYGPVPFSSPLNLTSMTSLQVWLGLASRYYWNWHSSAGSTKIHIAYTLVDTNGNKLSFGKNGVKVAVGGVSTTPAWSRINVPIPTGSTVFNYASVASYQVVITNQTSVPRLQWAVAWLDALTAYPASQTSTPVTRGNVYTILGIQGTVHAPVSLAFQQAPVAGTPTSVTTAGVGSYTVPAGTVYLKAEAIGGGGAGAGETGSGVGGGGGGGEYAAETQFPASPAQVIPYTVGAGGVQGATPTNGLPSVFGPGPSSSLVVTANGGQSAAQNSIVGGAGGSGSTNSQEYPGGTGRTASGSVGGGGGSSAAAGNPGNTPTGTASVVLTGSGNWSVPTGVTQITVTAVGAGGGAGTGGSGNGGGAGGGESATQTFSVTPGASIPYACGTGGTPGSSSGDSPGSAGGNTTFGPVSGTTLTAHGGAGGPTSTHSVAGGLGGSGSTAPVHFNGGQGGNTMPYGGGGGSSAGLSGAGNAGDGYGDAGIAPAGGGNGGAGSGPRNGTGASGSVPGGGGGATWASGYAAGTGGAGQITISYPGGAPTNNGAVAPTGGGAGGNGGGSANTAGSAGTAPGGGGGGADSTGTAESGGAGAAGKLIITPFSSPTFKTLIVHHPAPAAPTSYVPMVSVGGGTGVPNGATQYNLPEPITNVQADFDGTYTIILTVDSWNSPSSSRTITVTVYQYEYSGGASYPVSVSVTLTPNTQVTNGIVVVGTLTLPSKAVAPDNTGGYYAVAVTDTNTSDRFYDCLLLDTQGQTVIVNEPSGGYINYYLDEPDPTVDIGRILGSQFGRPDAISVSDALQSLSGGPITLEPGDNTLFAYCMEGAPAIGVSYYPRWYFDRYA